MLRWEQAGSCRQCTAEEGLRLRFIAQVPNDQPLVMKSPRGRAVFRSARTLPDCDGLVHVVAGIGEVSEGAERERDGVVGKGREDVGRTEFLVCDVLKSTLHL